MSKIVLSDELFVSYKTFHTLATPTTQQRKRYQRVLSNFVHPFKTNIEQLKRCKGELGDEVYKRLAPPLIASSKKGQSLQELAKETTYQFILTDSDTEVDLPYVNVKTQNVKQLYTTTCLAGESRQELIKHIEELCSKAKKILICDNYFAENWGRTQALFQSVLPRKKLTVEFVETNPALVCALNSSKINDTEIQKIFGDWNTVQSTDGNYSNRHDRYLKIDNKLEVMLSSGFAYLWNNSKEITCVFKEIQ